MDNRNVFVAIALSLAVLLFWGAFFETPKPIGTNDNFNTSQTKNKKRSESENITPNINQTELPTTISR